MVAVMKRAGIECVGDHVAARLTSPRGSGRGGMVRFGDDMCPGEYRIHIRPEDQDAANKALEAHNLDVRRWLYENGPMPEIIRSTI